MKKYFAIIISVTCCVFLFSCKGRKMDNVQHKVISNYKEMMECSDSSYYKSSALIKLETTDECLIKAISKIMFDENRLFIFDQLLKSVFIFDMNGKFLHTIKRVGMGPGEYTQLNCVCLNVSKKQLILVPDTPHKIYYLDYDGNLLREVERTKSITFHQVTCHDGVIYATCMHPDTENDFCYVYTIDDNGKEKCLFKYPEIFQNLYYIWGSYITKTKNLNFTIRCENFIYEIVDKQVMKKYEIDFGKYNLPKQYKRADISSEEFFDAGNKDYIYGIIEVIDGDNYLVFRTNQPYTYMYSKTEDLLTRIRFIQDSKYAISWSNMYHIENMPNSIAYTQDVASLLDFKNAWKFWEDENLAEQKQNFWNLTESMHFEDNPVLMIYNFK
jgi:hypothetical protein